MDSVEVYHVVRHNGRVLAGLVQADYVVLGIY
jgi:hypothetical protein